MHLQGEFCQITGSVSADVETTAQTCARVLLPESERRPLLKRFRRPNMENMERTRLSKRVNGAARKMVYCPYCSATNGVVKKVASLKIVHDKFRAKKTAEEMMQWKQTFQKAVETQKELGPFVNRAIHEDMNPLKVMDLFKRISDEVRVFRNISMLPCLLPNLVRTASCLALIQRTADQRNSSGNTYPFLLSVSAPPSLRMAHPTKMI